MPKPIKRLLREYAAAAHEEELRRALLPISEAFGRWASAELGSGELSEIIHRFHQGPARELWARYNTPHLEIPVAFAITTGVLGRGTIPAELLEHLAGALRFNEEERVDIVSSGNEMATAQVYQFKLVLVGVEPPIWRRIQVPETYSFWDLHVALQDSMGWLDYHLHVFRQGLPTRGLRRRPWLREPSDRDPGPLPRGLREHTRVARWSIRPRQVRPEAREVRRPCPPLSPRLRGPSHAGQPRTSHNEARAQAAAQKHSLNEPPEVTDPVDSAGSHSPELPALVEKTRRGDRTRLTGLLWRFSLFSIAWAPPSFPHWEVAQNPGL